MFATAGSLNATNDKLFSVLPYEFAIFKLHFFWAFVSAKESALTSGQTRFHDFNIIYCCLSENKVDWLID